MNEAEYIKYLKELEKEDQVEKNKPPQKKDAPIPQNRDLHFEIDTSFAAFLFAVAVTGSMATYAEWLNNPLAVYAMIPDGLFILAVYLFRKRRFFTHIIQPLSVIAVPGLFVLYALAYQLGDGGNTIAAGMETYTAWLRSLPFIARAYLATAWAVFFMFSARGVSEAIFTPRVIASRHVGIAFGVISFPCSLIFGIILFGGYMILYPQVPGYFNNLRGM